MAQRFVAAMALATMLLGTALGVVGCSFAGAPASPAARLVRTISASSTVFIPSVLKVPPDAPVSVIFRNNSREPHTFIFLSPISAGTDEPVAPGQSRTVEFTAPGPGDYSFVCNVHEGMTGTLRVE